MQEFNVLGPFQARAAGGTALDFGHRKVQALLVYLAVERSKPHSREHLASLLWARTGEDRARHNLRQALSKLRAVSPDLIETHGDTILLRPNACTVDVVRFEALARGDTLGDLQLALDLFRGDLLEGYTPNEAEYQDWLQLARARLRKTACETATRLAARQRAEGRDLEAMDVLNRLLRLEQANESAHRELMVLLAQTGRRSEALRQYQECEAALARELDTRPDPKTQAVLARIKAGESQVDPSREQKSRKTAAEAAPVATPAPGNAHVSSAPGLPQDLLLPDKPSLLVRHFANMSNDPEQNYFAAGLTKDIDIALVKIPGLFLAADETPDGRASRGLSTAQLGSKFGVRYVLSGAVRKAGNRVRVNAELMDASTGQCVWGERYDRELNDLFAIQDEITEEIVTAMDVKLMQGDAARFMRRAFRNPAALEASYKGWHALYHGGVMEAQALFDHVTRLEPESPLGYAFAALAHWAEAGFGRVVVDSPAMDRAAELAGHALALGDTTGYANLILALMYLAKRDYEQARAQATQGVTARPSCNGAFAIKASVLNFLGESREALEFAEYAVRLTPVYPAEFPAVLAAVHHDSGRYEQAIAAAEASLRLRGNDIDPMLFLAASKIALGDRAGGEHTATDVLTVDPHFSVSRFAKTQPYRHAENLERLVMRLQEAGLPA